jgi:AraC-like DNA-binding protein
MEYLVHKPAPPLADFVQFMWRMTNPGAPSSRRRVYPDGAMSLVIHLANPTSTFFINDEQFNIKVPLLAGPYSHAFDVDPSLSTALIGVVFQPFAGRAFFPIAAHELHNVDISLGDLLPYDSDELLEAVCTAPDAHSQFMSLERYLNKRLTNAFPIHPKIRYAVGQLSRTGGLRRVRKVQTDIGLSHTRFIQLFREHVGMTPKLFCRVQRFCALRERISKGLLVNWADLAADCGYFDQAHLIRDFRQFAGLTPLEYRRETSASEANLLAEIRAS